MLCGLYRDSLTGAAIIVRDRDDDDLKLTLLTVSIKLIDDPHYPFQVLS